MCRTAVIIEGSILQSPLHTRLHETYRGPRSTFILFLAGAAGHSVGRDMVRVGEENCDTTFSGASGHSVGRDKVRFGEENPDAMSAVIDCFVIVKVGMK